ncbi:MAG: fibronectin type III domain-containing protein [Anaerovoracaceae bacterium]|jgi:hypothetical protein
MRRLRRIPVLVLSAVLVLSLAGSLALASETYTSEEYNHGTISIRADEAESGSLSMAPGDQAVITISPYMHVQYRGCQMSDGTKSCPDICGGEICFVRGKGCSCEQNPVTRTTKAAAVSSDKNVVKAGKPSASGAVDSSVGSMVDGTLPLKAVSPGTATVTVTASLCDWVTATREFTVKVALTEEYKTAVRRAFRRRQPRLIRCKAGAKKLTVSWKRTAGAEKYQLCLARKSGRKSRSKTITVRSGRTLKKTVTGLKRRKTYRVRVRAYKKIYGQGAWTQWSAAKKAKTK